VTHSTSKGRQMVATNQPAAGNRREKPDPPRKRIRLIATAIDGLALGARTATAWLVAHAAMTHSAITAAHHRQGVEGPLLIGAEHRVERPDRGGATLELGVPPGQVIGDAIEALRCGHAAGGGVVHALVMIARRRGHGRLEGLERGFLVRAKVEDGMQGLGASLLAIMHPGGALVGPMGGVRSGWRRILGLDSVGDRDDGGHGRETCGGPKEEVHCVQGFPTES
jgi:hypothetical protein